MLNLQNIEFVQKILGIPDISLFDEIERNRILYNVSLPSNEMLNNSLKDVTKRQYPVITLQIV